MITPHDRPHDRFIVLPFTDAAPATEPALRPEVIERGRELASEPTYPPFEVCEQIATTWLGSTPPFEPPLGGA